jgi:hypothetical protein
MNLQEVEWFGMYWIILAQNMDGWLALVNAVMKCGVPKHEGISEIAVNLFASQEGLCTIDKDI